MIKGEYHFEWIYFYKHIPENQLGMEFKWITVDGLSDGALECHKCEYGFSDVGAKQCERCHEFTYFDSDLNKVI